VEWRTFNQRLILLVLLSGLVIGLIAAGLDPYVALAVAAGILWLLKDAWTVDSSAKASGRTTGGPGAGRALAPGAGDAGAEADTPANGEPESAPGDGLDESEGR
jgi:hypothetical protein